MIENMFHIVQRISDIQKRFGLKRHNIVNNVNNVNEKLDFNKNLQNSIIKYQDNSLKTDSEMEFGRKDNIDKLVDKYAEKNKIPSSLIKSVIMAESSYNPNAVSKKGAKGLMQLMPSIIKERGVTDPFSPEENIKAGTSLLKDLLNDYNGDYKKALAAYNAGKGAVKKYNGVPEYKETQEYVKKVIDSYLKNR